MREVRLVPSATAAQSSQCHRCLLPQAQGNFSLCAAPFRCAPDPILPNSLPGGGAPARGEAACDVQIAADRSNPEAATHHALCGHTSQVQPRTMGTGFGARAKSARTGSDYSLSVTRDLEVVKGIADCAGWPCSPGKDASKTQRQQ